MTFKQSRFRVLLVVSFVALIFFSYVVAMIRLQLVNGEYYKEQSEQKIYSTENITASRGSIYDCNGVSLVTNTTGYCIRFTRALMPVEQQNDIILSLIRLTKEHKCSYYDNLPLTMEKPFQYTSEIAEGNTPKKLFSALEIPGTSTADDDTFPK